MDTEKAIREALAGLRQMAAKASQQAEEYRKQGGDFETPAVRCTYYVGYRVGLLHAEGEIAKALKREQG